MPPLSLRIDPHVHSAASFDATASIDAILRRARAVGLDGVVVTDHDELDASLEAAERAAEFGLVGIPGVEVSTAVGHLLALGVERRPELGLPLAETVRQIRTQGGVAVVPHPFQRSRHGIRKSDLGDVDGIEVYNGLAMTGYRNRCARLFAAQCGYPMIGGSDAHTPDLIGRTHTQVLVDTPADRPADVSPSAVLDGIKAGATRIEGRRTPLSRYVRKHAWHAEYRTSMVLRAGVGALVARLV
ncbi:CehA/McbA family metallohydrolase [Halorientalis brevis]|uniref:CehA/McbA family metallohydrolase n=1 Tax=Halorientalis brevis TaxID=1126241 RepID=A0ABD6CC22_9EURY|nr:PHP domain-containing protein [Halorientalis brevis]